MTSPVSSSVPSSGSVTTGYHTANAHAPIGARMYCQAKAKAHIHMIAGLAPATKIEACLAEKYSQYDLEKIKGETPDSEGYFEMVGDFNIDKDYLPLYSVNNLLEKEYHIFNETFEERMELFLDFLNNCKDNLQTERHILIVSHSSVLQKIIFKMYNEEVSLKMGEFLIKKLKVQKKTRRMSLKKSFLL